GNIVRWANKVIMTDRVFIDNPKYERKRLIKELHELLQVDHLHFVPEQPGDFTGHSDGMVRFIDENTVVINDFKLEKEWFIGHLKLLSIIWVLTISRSHTRCMTTRATTTQTAITSTICRWKRVYL